MGVECPCPVRPRTGCYPDEEFLELPHLARPERSELPERQGSARQKLRPLAQQVLSELEQQARPGRPVLLPPGLAQPEPERPGSVQPGQPSARPLLALRLGMPHEAF